MSSPRRLLLLAVVLLVACVVAGEQHQVSTSIATAAAAPTGGPDDIVNRLLVDYVSDPDEVLSYGSAPNSSYPLGSITEGTSVCLFA